MILYLRVVPGLRIAIEERDHPELFSRSLVIGSLQGRGLVQEANFVAQRQGIRPGMTLSQARQHCPDCLVLMPDQTRHDAAWEEVCNILCQYTPLTEPIEMGQAVCDLAGCEHLWGGWREAARDIAAHIWQRAGISSWIGIASNRLVAQLASTAVDASGMTLVKAGQEKTFLASLPIALLPEMDPGLETTLHVLGIKTIGQFAELPVSAVAQRFGVMGKKLHIYACGRDSRPVLPPPVKPSVSACYQFEDGSPEEALSAIHQLANICVTELRERRLAGKLVELALIAMSPRPSLPFIPNLSLNLPVDRSSVSEASGPITPNTPDPILPIPYRIHSSLPQPGPTRNYPKAHLPALSYAGEFKGQAAASLGAYKGKIAIRIPIETVPTLFDQAKRLLIRLWPRNDEKKPLRLQTLTLTVSEFETPAQLSFDELNRLDQAGRLSGLTLERRQAIARQEEIFASRHDSEPFQHVTRVDLGNVLSERRFHWEAGLSWNQPRNTLPSKGRRGKP